MALLSNWERKGYVRALLNVLAIRFGEIPPPIQETVRYIRDEKRLSKLVKTAVTGTSLSEFECAILRRKR